MTEGYEYCFYCMEKRAENGFLKHDKACKFKGHLDWDYTDSKGNRHQGRVVIGSKKADEAFARIMGWKVDDGR